MKVRKIRQVISTLLTTALLFSLMSMSAFAADTTVGLSFDVLDLSVQNYNSKETFLDSYASTAAPLHRAFRRCETVDSPANCWWERTMRN